MFNYTRPIDGLYEMNLICSKFLEAAEFKKDQILFGRCLEDNKDDADFMIVPLGDTIEKLRSKFEEKKMMQLLLQKRRRLFYILQIWISTSLAIQISKMAKK